MQQNHHVSGISIFTVDSLITAKDGMLAYSVALWLICLFYFLFMLQFSVTIGFSMCCSNQKIDR